MAFRKITHLVLKSTGKISLYQNRKFITETIENQAMKSGLKLYGLSVQHDHIHHSILCPNKPSYNAFVRAVTGLLARKYGRRMWKYRPYTKTIEWGRQQRNLKRYIEQNELEVRGVIPYQSRKK